MHRRAGYRPGPLAAIPELDCPIIAPAEVAEIYGTVEVFDCSEWDHACQQEEDRWMTTKEIVDLVDARTPKPNRPSTYRKAR